MAVEDLGAKRPDQSKPGPQRLHIDDDWKMQAQAEKERLSQEVEQRAAAGAPGGETELIAGGRRPSALPPADFSLLVQSLATQAAIFLSDQRDPETGESLRNPDLAKHNIDLLRVLDEKTRGNLTDSEKRLLDTLLYELQMAYVEAAG